MGSRRRAREVALQILFQLDTQEALTVEQAVAYFFKYFARREDGEGEAGLDDSGADFAGELVRGVRENLAELDALITRASRNWRLERMARVDRNLLRLAAYEMRHSADVPVKVAINEAIEIAKRYGTSESPAFVNGILDRVLEEIGQKP